MNGTGSCRSCGASIVWVVTEHGKKMPIDAQPLAWPDGNLELSTVGAEVRVRVVKERTPDGNMYRSHFASCKSAAQHRKPKGSH